jgi:hypothetical protein
MPVILMDVLMQPQIRGFKKTQKKHTDGNIYICDILGCDFDINELCKVK